MLYKEKEWKALLRNKRILIAGYGREGRSSERFLSALMPRGQFEVADGNENILRLAPMFDIILKSPGIPTMIFEGVCPLDKISSQTDLFLQMYGGQTVAVSGTKGKSTTTELIYQMLAKGGSIDGKLYSHAVKAGNMGIPLFDIIEQLSDDTLVVAELSCHQLENIHRAPHIGVLLNLFPEHLDHYHDYNGYKQAKLNMLRCQQSEDLFFYCADNDTLRNEVMSMTPRPQSKVMSYSAADPYKGTLSDSLLGNHNRSNVTVAVMVARACGVADRAIVAVTSGFQGLRYRMERVGCYDGIEFYDDSISTIPEAAIAAVDALQRVDTIILGGMDRGIPYDALCDYLPSSKIRNIAFVGKAGRRILEQITLSHPDFASKRNILTDDRYDHIVPWCFDHTAVGKICLLSPAAASYDAFDNFEHRGRTFDQLVRLVALRHSLHQHPGLSGCEQYAHDTIVSNLKDCNPTELHTHVGGYGVVAFWGDINLPCIALRADTDALPINEQSAAPYCSETNNVSHKCGHDGHTAILLRVAQLVEQKGLKQVMLIFQPEEETGMGARKVLESGVLNQYNIKYITAIHNLPGFPAGQVVLSRNTFAAASTGIIYRLKGRQTHASTPEKGINPGLCVAEIINNILALNTSPDAAISVFQQATLICVRLGDEAFGTSAGCAEVMFTLRAYTNEKMKELLAQTDAIVKAATVKQRVSWTSEQREPFSATENNTALVDDIFDFLIHNNYNVHIKSEPFRWSEDFGNYLQCYDGMMFGVGAGENTPELHHPDYDFPDEIIESTAQLFLKIVSHWKNNNQ